MSETVSNETVELDEKAAELVPVIQKSNEGIEKIIISLVLNNN